LMMFITVIVPVEILDIWWGQFAVSRAIKKIQNDKITPEIRKIFNRYDRLIYASIPVLIITWIFFFLMAVLKPI